MVVWSFPARDDLKAIYDYIVKDSKNYAGKVIDDIVESSEQLTEFPKIGRIVPEVEKEYIRELFIYSYRLIYEIKNDDIYVLAVIHGARNFTKEMLRV